MEASPRRSILVGVSPLAHSATPLATQRYVQDPDIATEPLVAVRTPCKDASRSPAVVATQQATGILPERHNLTQMIYQRGTMSGAAVGAHTARAGRSRSSQRRMKRASRIAYRRVTAKDTPVWLPWVCAVFGFTLLVGALYWLATTYIQHHPALNVCQ